MDHEAKESTINVLMVEPLKAPYVTEVKNDYRAMQDLVGGLFQAVYTEDAACLMNDEGKLLGLPFNRALRDEYGKIYDVIAGSFFICGLGNENFASLTNEQIEHYTDRFRKIEWFYRDIDGRIMVVELE